MSGKKTRILVWADSPAVSTGFATVSRNIFNNLAKTGKYEIDVLGINDTGDWKDPNKFPYKIFPARSNTEQGGDFHGRPRLVTAVLGKDRNLVPPWDIIFTLNDPFIHEEAIPVFNKGVSDILTAAKEASKNNLPSDWYFKIVSYVPVDSRLKGNWIQAIAQHDYLVPYSEYAKEEMIKADDSLDQKTEMEEKLVDPIYHGFNEKDFFYIDREDKDLKEFRDNYFKGRVKDDTFLISVVARNQPRKDIPRTMKIFKEFKRRRPDSFLYINAQESDVGGSLLALAEELGLRIGEDWGCPSKFSANTGISVESLNKIYNLSDVILSTSLGEGFGLYNLEAMATKTLVVGPDNTVHPEIYGYDDNDDISDIKSIKDKIRGVPVLAGSNLSEFVNQGGSDFDRYRPIVNVEDAVKKLIWIYDNPDEAEKIAERGHEWVQNYTWDKIAEQWEALFDKIVDDLQKERKRIDKKRTQEMINGRKKNVDKMSPEEEEVIDS